MIEYKDYLNIIDMVNDLNSDNTVEVINIESAYGYFRAWFKRKV